MHSHQLTSLACLIISRWSPSIGSIGPFSCNSSFDLWPLTGGLNCLGLTTRSLPSSKVGCCKAADALSTRSNVTIAYVSCTQCIPGSTRSNVCYHKYWWGYTYSFWLAHKCINHIAMHPKQFGQNIRRHLLWFWEPSHIDLFVSRHFPIQLHLMSLASAVHIEISFCRSRDGV